MKKLNKPEDYKEIQERLAKQNKKKKILISISNATCGQARGSDKIVKAFLKREKELLKKNIYIKSTGCHGFCEAEPNIIIYPEGVFYQHLKEKDIPELIENIIKGKIIEKHLYTQDGKVYKTINEIPFYKKQMRLLLGLNSLIDPTSIEDYISYGGYSGFTSALQKDPGEVLEMVKNSGLRGRGGAGFKTGLKWEFVKNSPEKIKYIICNGDEGDPGAYMDRNLLESNPHMILEGMLIGGYTMGAVEGWIYVRHEYPLAVTNIIKTIDSAKKAGLLGKKILGSNFNFDVRVMEGAGAFVCGEETALIQSIEGMRGNPRQRPPFPAQKGLFGKPTNINNVETWANIPQIILKGSAWFSKIGTETSKGTKIFSLVGKVRNTGLVEVPMGMTLKEIIYEIGGGIPEEKRFKAVQTGGPSGGCLPEEKINLPVDYESLTGAGAIMGSGGMIVMDENTCMVDVAKYFLKFLQDESCGKCVPCREGIQRMHEIVDGITHGIGSQEILDLLEELAVVVKDTSMCGLGQTAPNPILSTLEYFKHEFTEHIQKKKCSSGVCKDLIIYTINPENCVGCGLCRKACPQDAIIGETKKPHEIIAEKCIKCGMCQDACNFKAIIIK